MTTKPSDIATPVAVENRKAARRDASLVPSITAVRLSPHGAEAKLLNISATGVLVECATRLQPGSPVTVNFEGGFTPASVDSRVARSSVAAVSKGGGIRYQIGLAFKQPIDLEDLPAPPPQEPTAALPVDAPTPPRPAPVPLARRNRW